MVAKFRAYLHEAAREMASVRGQLRGATISRQEIAENRSSVQGIVGKRSGGAIHVFPPPPSELFIVIRRERKVA